MAWMCMIVLALFTPGTEGATNTSMEHPGPKWTLSSRVEKVDADTANRLVKRAEAARGALESFDRHLLAANWMMAYELEPMATRLLLRASESKDAASVAEKLAVVADQLEAARKVWETLREDKSLSRDARWQREGRLAGLRAFAEAFASLWPTPEVKKETRRAALRRAASDIAVVLEDDRPGVAAGAQLWQAYLYAQSDRLPRAIDLLPAALSKPPNGDVFGFYARLLRCRYVAREHGGFAAAAALLARIEKRGADWFEAESDQEAASRAAALVRRSVLADWEKSFREAGKPQRAQWCRAAIARLDEQFFPPGSPNEVLRLLRAVPYLVDEAQLKEALKEKQKKPQPSALEEDPKPDMTSSGVGDPTSTGIDVNSGTAE